MPSKAFSCPVEPIKALHSYPDILSRPVMLAFIGTKFTIGLPLRKIKHKEGNDSKKIISKTKENKVTAE
jgi:hypothetical protein